MCWRVINAIQFSNDGDIQWRYSMSIVIIPHPDIDLWHSVLILAHWNEEKMTINSSVILIMKSGTSEGFMPNLQSSMSVTMKTILTYWWHYSVFWWCNADDVEIHCPVFDDWYWSRLVYCYCDEEGVVMMAIDDSMTSVMIKVISSNQCRYSSGSIQWYCLFVYSQ